MLKLNLPLVLVSTSPRRSELLSLLGIPFTIVAPKFEEKIKPGEKPKDYALRNAFGKLESFIEHVNYDCYAVSADTIVVMKEENKIIVLEKPKDENEAFEMIKFLSGNVHRVYTALAVAVKRKGVVEGQASITKTQVEFKELEDSEIKNYIKTKEPYDKCGGYAILGRSSYMIRGIQGSFTNVMGLPMDEVHDLLKGL